MDDSTLTPVRMTTPQWYEHTRTWGEETFVDAAASISPDAAAACEAHPWPITVRLGEIALEVGDHVAVELHVGWTPDRGRPLVYGRQVLQEGWNPGYGATPRIELPDGVEHRFAISEPQRMNRFFIIDMVITAGAIAAGSTFRIFLADPDGTLLRCPWFAQDVPVPVAIRKKDDAHYRRLREIPVLHVAAGRPRLWKVVAGPQADPETVRVQVIAADLENLNPAPCTSSPAALRCEGWEDVELAEEAGYHGAPVWRGTARRNPGAATRLEFLNRDVGLYGRSNPVIPDLHDPMRIFWGDPHGQSDRSIGFGTEREYFWWARDAELLDFAAPANHYGGREVLTDAIWRETLALCEEFHDPGRFATLFSYEWGGGQNAHRNVYYAETPGALFDAHDPACGTVEKLWRALDAQALPTLTIPHHTRFIGRIDWAEFHDRYQRLVEVCSCWGSSEMGGPHSVQTGLAMGHRLGVVGGTDTHFSQPGRSAFGPFDLGGLTAVICGELDRKALWDALCARRCYATTGERILLDFRVNGQRMGSEVPSDGPRRITGRVVGTAALTSVEIVRNNEVWRTLPVEGEDTGALAWEDTDPFESIALTPSVPAGGRFAFYYLRARQDDRHEAVSSPIWIVEDRS